MALTPQRSTKEPKPNRTEQIAKLLADASDALLAVILGNTKR